MFCKQYTVSPDGLKFVPTQYSSRSGWRLKKKEVYPSVEPDSGQRKKSSYIFQMNKLLGEIRTTYLKEPGESRYYFISHLKKPK